MMEHARERGLARLLVINKIDFDGADLRHWSRHSARSLAANACR
jgi:hypothetical protein